MKDVENNIIYFDLDNKSKVIIREIIDYNGSKEKAVYFKENYNDVAIKKTMSYDKFNKWIKKLVKMEEKDTFKEMRSILFDTLRGVKDGTIEADKAKTISSVSQTLINSAKVEIDYIKTVNNKKKSNLLE